MHNIQPLDHFVPGSDRNNILKHEKARYFSRAVKGLQANIFAIHLAMNSLHCLKKIRHRLLDFSYLSKNVCLTDIF